MKVLVVEDHPIVVSGCKALFQKEADVELRHASSVADAQQAYDEMQPDVSVIDINLPDGSGLDLAQDILADNNMAKIVMFTMSDAPVLAVRAMDIGARGFVSKNGDPDLLRDAVVAVNEGRHWLPPDILQEIALMRTGVAGQKPELSRRQIQILRALSQGRNMSEIAHDLDVCYKTVASNCAELRSKLNARTSSELVRIAVELRLV